MQHARHLADTLPSTVYILLTFLLPGTSGLCRAPVLDRHGNGGASLALGHAEAGSGRSALRLPLPHCFAMLLLA